MRPILARRVVIAQSVDVFMKSRKNFLGKASAIVLTSPNRVL